jgi:hypothetical protein
MLIFQTYDEETNDTLPDECLSEIEAILNKYGYEMVDVSNNKIVFES